MSRAHLRHAASRSPGALGMSLGQKNVLARIVLRVLNQTLTSEACNLYRDAIYAKLHEGTVWHWAAKT